MMTTTHGELLDWFHNDVDIDFAVELLLFARENKLRFEDVLASAKQHVDNRLEALAVPPVTVPPIISYGNVANFSRRKKVSGAN